MTPSSSSSMLSSLPHPRLKPLRAGGKKEDATRNYLDDRILEISRKFMKKFQPAEENRVGDIKGYVSMEEVAADFDRLANIVWLSGTRMIVSFLPAFPPAPKATFSLLKKMDHAFSSLLKGKDRLTGEVLPGFSGDTNSGMSKTDMVRLQSLVQKTRILIIGLLGDDKHEENSANSKIEVSLDYPDHQDMALAEIYEHTIVQLGKSLQIDEVSQFH